MAEPLLNGRQLAEALGRGSNAGYVTAMKACGYAFLYATRTTRAHALKWLRANPQFRSTGYFLAHRKKQEVAKAPRSPRAAHPSVGAGKSGASAPRNGRQTPSRSARPHPS